MARLTIDANQLIFKMDMNSPSAKFFGAPLPNVKEMLFKEINDLGLPLNRSSNFTSIGWLQISEIPKLKLDAALKLLVSKEIISTEDANNVMQQLQLLNPIVSSTHQPR